METLLVKSPLNWRRTKIPISAVLMQIVGQEGRDSEEDDIVQRAAEYIDELEQRVEALETLLNTANSLLTRK